MNSFEITFQPSGKRTTISKDQTILDAARKSGIGLSAICGGMGTCHECRVRLISGELTTLTFSEEAAFGVGDLRKGWRLACQVKPLSNVILYTQPESLTTAYRLQTEGLESDLVPDPVVHTPGAHGLAVDIGTTKIAAYLVSLSNGKTLAKIGEINPQISYGEDIISRIKFVSTEHKGGKLLQSILMKTINKLLGEMCAETHITQDTVLAAVLVGNTVMHHLSAGLSIEQLGQAPFTPSTLKPLTIPAAALGLELGPNSQVYFPPVVAGYVGADHLAMILSTGIGTPCGHRSNETIIALDIGTNTEITLCSNNMYSCCSCASGPAFEGAHIKEGMRAAPGAIERARWSDGKIIFQTIDELPPLGICGSGILDIIAALIDGQMVKPSGALISGKDFCVVPRERNGLDRDLMITRNDVHEIQLAKSAVRSGIEVLLASMKVDGEKIDKFIIAGAFGTYLDIKSAIKIGIFPNLPHARFIQVGNAAGMGAIQMLLSLEKRHQAEKIATQLRYVELASNKQFTSLFIKHLNFK